MMVGYSRRSASVNLYKRQTVHGVTCLFLIALRNAESSLDEDMPGTLPLIRRHNTQQSISRVHSAGEPCKSAAPLSRQEAVLLQARFDLVQSCIQPLLRPVIPNLCGCKAAAVHAIVDLQSRQHPWCTVRVGDSIKD